MTTVARMKKLVALMGQARRLNELPDTVKIIWGDLRNVNCAKATDQERLNCSLDWLCAASDASSNEGISAGFSILWGWSPPYPETTGYIIPTLYEAARLENRPDLAKLATRQAEWIVSLQEDSGGIPGGTGIHGQPVVFDTGQALFGLLAAYRETGQRGFLSAAEKAGSFLIDSLDDQGRFTRNLYLDCIHTYDVRVSWALLMLYQQTGLETLRSAAEANLKWSLTQQTDNGFFLNNAFGPQGPTYTHAIGYVLRGMLECAGILDRQDLFQSVHRGLNVLLGDALNKGFLAAKYSPNWGGDYSSTCLTGDCQIAIVFHRMADIADDPDSYRQASLRLVQNVKSTQNLTTSHPGIRGGIKGSHPVWGKYQRFNFPNWAVKFFVDCLLLEIHGQGGSWG